MLEEIGLLSGWLAEPPRCRLLPAGFLGPSLCCAFSMRRGRPVVTVVTLARGGRSGRARARGEIPARGCSCVFARGNSSPLFHLPIPPPLSPLNPTQSNPLPRLRSNSLGSVPRFAQEYFNNLGLLAGEREYLCAVAVFETKMNKTINLFSL